MSEEKNIALSNQVYETLCKALDARGWSYKKDEEDLSVYFAVGGEDLQMNFYIIVDAERELIRLMSLLPFNMSEENRIDGVVATLSANNCLIDGNFDYDISTGAIVFKITSCFEDSVIGEDLIQYMISCACAVVDRYNDLFFALDKGAISISEFIAKINF